MLFFVWYDDRPKTLVVDKIQAAVTAYAERFKTRPSLVLVNAIDYVEMPADSYRNVDLLVRSELTVQPNTFWVQHEGSSKLPHS
jgi:hypothetical protein